jgi:hypothetical protein
VFVDMTKGLIAALAALALLLPAGCGGDDEGGNEGGTGGGGTSFTKASASCDSKGVDGTRGNTGTCSRDGVTYTVANRDQPLELEEMEVKILDLQIARSIKLEQGGQRVRPKGVFIIPKLQIRNKTDKPQQVGGPGFEQAAVGDGRVQYVETPSTLRKDSFFLLGKIPPGGQKTGTLLFDVPARVARNLEARKAVMAFVNFSDTGAIKTAKRLGIIRLWKGGAPEA